MDKCIAERIEMEDDPSPIGADIGQGQHILPWPNGVNYYMSMDQMVVGTGISKAHLKIAKKLGAPGFDTNGRINLIKFEPWWKLHKLEVEGTQEDTLTKWKTRKTKADAQIAEIELDELKEKTLDKDQVKDFLKSIASAQMAVLKSKLCQELPPKILGLGLTETAVIMDATVKEICEIFQKGLGQWE